MSQLRSEKIPREYPVYARDEETLYTALQKAETTWQKARTALLDRLRGRAVGKRLRADTVLSELFASVKVWKRRADAVARARQRVELGNPPGKRGSLGDAVNWEILKDSVPERADLILVSGDSDFRSDLDKTQVMPFLKNEWKKDKKSEITLYTSLLDFVRKHQADVHLSVEHERVVQQNRLVSQLEMSTSFMDTHAVLSRLVRSFPLTDGNVERTIMALKENNQVGWIGEDPDVKAFFLRIGRDQRMAIPSHLMDELLSRYAELRPQSEEDDPVPF